MEPIVIAKIMGHSDIGLIFKVYAEVQEKFKNKEMEKINKYYIDENIGMLDKEYINEKEEYREYLS